MCVPIATSSTTQAKWVAEPRSEEHTSELQSLRHLVCRLLLEKKNEDFVGGGIPRRYPALKIQAENGERGGVEEDAEFFIAAARGQLARREHKFNDVAGCDEQHSGKSDSVHRRNDAGVGREPVQRLPDGQDFHEVSDSAAHDEQTECPDIFL